MSSIASEITRIQGAKTALKTAIEDKGVTVPQTAKIEDYAGFVEEIEQGGGGSSYSYTTGKIRGLQDLGWDEESIGSYNDNLGVYSWEGGSVSEANKALYGVVNASNLGNYSGNTDMEYLPAFDFNSNIYNYPASFKNLKGCPKITFSGDRTVLNTFFYNCSNLMVAPLFAVNSITEATSMFSGCISLHAVPQYDLSSCTNTSSMFYGCKSLKAVPQYDLSSCTKAGGMFSGCSTLKNVKLVNTGSITDMNNMFAGCQLLQNVDLNMSACTDAHNMFDGCSGLTSITLTNTSNLTNMQYMFQNCKAITEFPLFDTGNVTNMAHCFDQVGAATIPLYDTSKVTNMQYMFSASEITTIPLYDTSKVTDMQYMFSSCKITTIPALNTSSLQNTNYMFNSCTKLTSLPELDFGNVTAMTHFFGSYAMSELTDLGGFKNLKCKWDDNYGLYKCDNLTVQSLLNVLNDLYDFTGHSETPTSSQGKLKLGTKNYNKLTAEQIAIGTNKGWTITA